jgi:hypothetical protein
MREFIASLPAAIQLALFPVIGVVVGFCYALCSKSKRDGSHHFGLKIVVATVTATIGGFYLANYLDCALVSLLLVWLYGRFLLSRDDRTATPPPAGDT